MSISILCCSFEITDWFLAWKQISVERPLYLFGSEVPKAHLSSVIP